MQLVTRHEDAMARHPAHWDYSPIDTPSGTRQFSMQRQALRNRNALARVQGATCWQDGRKKSSHGLVKQMSMHAAQRRSLDGGRHTHWIRRTRDQGRSRQAARARAQMHPASRDGNGAQANNQCRRPCVVRQGNRRGRHLHEFWQHRGRHAKQRKACGAVRALCGTSSVM